MRNFIFLLFVFHNGMVLASETPCDKTNQTAEIKSSLFRQTWSAQLNNYPGDGSFAMWCDGETCDIAKPIKRTNRKYIIDGNTILLNYGMEEYKIEKIQILDLTGSTIRLKFPEIKNPQTFYRVN